LRTLFDLNGVAYDERDLWISAALTGLGHSNPIALGVAQAIGFEPFGLMGYYYGFCRDAEACPEQSASSDIMQIHYLTK